MLQTSTRQTKDGSFVELLTERWFVCRTRGKSDLRFYGSRIRNSNHLLRKPHHVTQMVRLSSCLPKDDSFIEREENVTCGFMLATSETRTICGMCHWPPVILGVFYLRSSGCGHAYALVTISPMPKREQGQKIASLRLRCEPTHNRWVLSAPFPASSTTEDSCTGNAMRAPSKTLVGSPILCHRGTTPLLSLTAGIIPVLTCAERAGKLRVHCVSALGHFAAMTKQHPRIKTRHKAKPSCSCHSLRSCSMPSSFFF